MTPGSSGPVGLYDDQAISNWSEFVPAFQYKAAAVGNVGSGFIDVSRYGWSWSYTRGQDQIMQAIYWWYTDKTRTQVVHAQQFTWDPAVTQGARINYPNLGPWLEITLSPQGGAAQNWNPDFVLYRNNVGADANGANGTSPIWSFGGTIPAGGSNTQVMGTMVASKVAIYTFGGNQGLTLEWQFESFNYTWVRMNRYTVAANADDYREFVFPFNPVRVIITNQSAVNPCTGVVMSANPLYGIG